MGSMRFGVHKTLDDEASAIIRAGQKRLDVPPADPSLFLTPAKEALRRRKEIFVSGGVPDAALRVGVYSRAMNPRQPHLNSRDGAAPPARESGSPSRSLASLSDFMDQHLST